MSKDATINKASRQDSPQKTADDNADSSEFSVAGAADKMKEWGRSLGLDDDALQEMGDNWEDFSERAGETAREVDRSFREQVEARPYLAAGVALGVGFFLGSRWGRWIPRAVILTGGRAAARSLVGMAVSTAGAALAAKVGLDAFDHESEQSAAPAAPERAKRTRARATPRNEA